MSDNERDAAEGGAARGADWEVVTLTASAYAAAPGPGGGPAAEQEGRGYGAGSSSNALLMSDHFVFPPSEHENLPIETALEAPSAGDDVQEESTSVEDAGFQSVGAGAGSERVQYYDDGRNLSADEAEMLGDMDEHGSFCAEDDGHGSAIHDDGEDSQDRSEVTPDSRSRGSSGSPSQYWLKKHMVCLYDQAKETNALWSVVVAAAFVGLVILWRKDKLHLGCLKWRSSSAVRYAETLFIFEI
jgi:hypothetical protein